MKEEQKPKSSKKGGAHRRRTTEPTQFQTQITVQLDEFFRYFNCYYPGRNKDQIINKCITGNTYWITIDSQYYAESVDFEMEKLSTVRKKSALKNGVYPPTKDTLQEEKFILLARKAAALQLGTHQLQDIKRTPLSAVIQLLEQMLNNQEAQVSYQLGRAEQALKADNQKVEQQLQSLGIPVVKAARLFAYQKLEKDMIEELVTKARQKEQQPRCDFCFTRDKEIVKCKSCDLYAHPLCFSKVPKNGYQFQCDQCSENFPEGAVCQLCPLQGGHFLQLADEVPICSYELLKGDSNLRFKIKKENQGGRRRQFIHVSCFVLHPQCSYKQGKVYGLHYIDRNRKNTGLCLICGNMIGSTVPCTNDSCRRAYHPQCAKRNNLKINVIKANNKSLLQIYCQRHKKPESYEYLNDSVSNRIKELRKFYENLDYEIKRHGSGNSMNRQKRQTKSEDNIKWDLCLACSEQNHLDRKIINCRRCYGWRHEDCSKNCPICDA